MSELDLPRSSLLTKYRDSMQELQETLVKEKKWRQDAEAENRLLRKRNLEIEEQLTDFRYSSVEFIVKTEDLSSENKKLQDRNKDFQEHHKNFEEMLERQQIRAETLEKEVVKLEDLVSELKSELNEKQRTLEDWKTGFLHYEQQIKSLEQENFQIKEESSAYQKAFRDQEHEFNIKERETMDLLQRFNLLEMENQRYKEQENWIIESQKLLEIKTQQLIDDERKVVQNYKNKLMALNEDYEKVQIEKEKLGGLVYQGKMEISNLNEGISCLKRNKEEIEIIYNEKMESFQEELMRAEEKCRDKERAMIGLHGEIKLLNEKFLNLQVEYCGVKEQLGEKMKEINSVKAELHSKNEVIFEVSNKNKELSSHVQDLAETIEHEKVKASKDLQKLGYKFEQEIEKMKLNASSELEYEVNRKDQEIREVQDRFESFAKGKEDEVNMLNSDREKLQDMLRELDYKLRELLSNYQIESETWENTQKMLKEETNLRVNLENKYNSVLNRIQELENQVQASSETVSDLKSQLKANKKQFQSDSESFLKSVHEKIEFWKNKFREEVGYLEKWAQMLENDQQSVSVHKRIINIVNRLESVLDYTEN